MTLFSKQTFTSEFCLLHYFLFVPLFWIYMHKLLSMWKTLNMFFKKKFKFIKDQFLAMLGFLKMCIDHPSRLTLDSIFFTRSIPWQALQWEGAIINMASFIINIHIWPSLDIVVEVFRRDTFTICNKDIEVASLWIEFLFIESSAFQPKIETLVFEIQVTNGIRPFWFDYIFYSKIHD